MAGRKSKEAHKEAPEPQLHPLTGEAVSNPLVPDWIFEGLVTLSLTLPNLVFSGMHWYDTLHLMKWFVTLVPVGVLSVLAGARLARYGTERTGFVLDPLGTLWVGVLLFLSLQPFWAPLTSSVTFLKEWLTLGSLVALYLLTYNLFPTGNMIRVALWLANLNAAVNVLFAELQMRSLNASFPFIMNTPGYYIGNTAQQEMFGLWMAIAVLNGVYLHVAYGGQEAAGRIRQGALLRWGNLVLLAVNGWGLWNSTARGGILSLLVGFSVFALMAWRNYDRSHLRRLGAIVLVLGVVLAGSFVADKALNTGRATLMTQKTLDMIQNPGSVGLRIGIWRTSLQMFLHHPVTGVGLGHFKWNYLAAQRAMFDRYPDGEWQFTYWAHSEYLQWLCELGVFGGLLLAGMGLFWLAGFGRAVARREAFPLEILWAAGMVFLIATDAVFSRPFHRVEIAVWFAVALALSARSFLPARLSWTEVRHPAVFRAFGGLWAAVALGGLLFLGDGMLGDRYLFAATQSRDPNFKMGALDQAGKHFMSREEALEQKGYLYLLVAEANRDGRLLKPGLDLLYQAFGQRAEAKKLMDLMKGYGALGDEAKVREMTRFLKPGTFQLQKGGPASGAPRSAAP